MSPHEPSPSSYNLSGAVIFTAYVTSALFLTAFIAYDLTKSYWALTPSYLAKRVGRSSINTHVCTIFSLATLSFSVLSYHMLNFLFLSYTAWAQDRGIPLPLSSLGRRGLVGEIHIWQWLTNSTLFLDFAKEICATWPRYWWASQALWATLGVCCFMALHGTWVFVSLAYLSTVLTSRFSPFFQACFPFKSVRLPT